MAKTDVIVVDGGDLAPVPGPSFGGIFTGGGKSMQTSLPMGTKAEKLRVLNLLKGASERVAKHLNKVLVLTDVIAHRVTVVNKETGELGEALRVVLIPKTGKPVAATSHGIVKALGEIADTFGPPPWRDGIPVRLEQIETANNRRYFDLIPIESE